MRERNKYSRKTRCFSLNTLVIGNNNNRAREEEEEEEEMRRVEGHISHSSRVLQRCHPEQSLL